MAVSAARFAPWRRESDVMPTMEHELEVARGAAKAAGQVLLRYYGSAYRVAL